MTNITYSMLIKNSKKPEIIREKMVQRYYKIRNYSQVAREYHIKRQRVKFWVKRFEEFGIIFYWNLDRENLKLEKTPFRLIKEKCHIFNPQIANFQPFILDEMKTLWSNYLQKSVPYVADEINNFLLLWAFKHIIKK